MEFVPGRIAFEFREPEFPAVCWSRAIFAFAMSMPEAAVNEDNGFMFR